MNAQEIVAANVAARGYLAGWTQSQAAARQVAKATEELAELAQAIDGAEWFTDALRIAGGRARAMFDSPEAWDGVEFDPFIAHYEIADVIVPVLTLASLLQTNVLQAAIDKSSADVARGVR